MDAHATLDSVGRDDSDPTRTTRRVEPVAPPKQDVGGRLGAAPATSRLRSGPRAYQTRKAWQSEPRAYEWY